MGWEHLVNIAHSGCGAVLHFTMCWSVGRMSRASCAQSMEGILHHQLRGATVRSCIPRDSSLWSTRALRGEAAFGRRQAHCTPGVWLFIARSHVSVLLWGALSIRALSMNACLVCAHLAVPHQER